MFLKSRLEVIQKSYKRYAKYYELYKNDKINGIDFANVTGLKVCEIKGYLNKTEMNNHDRI